MRIAITRLLATAAIAASAPIATGACSSQPLSSGTAPPPSSPPPAAPPASAAPSPSPSSLPPRPPLPSLDDLSSRASALARGMHEVARGEISSDKPPSTRAVVRADAADTCARVAFVAQPAVHVSLRDGRGDLLADVPSSTDTPIGPLGPVCVRKGDVIALSVDGTGAWAARFVAWASP